MKKEKYLIMQGVINASGCGDYFEVAKFATKKEAIKFFNKIKKDTRDFCPKHNFLATELISIQKDELIDCYEILIK